MIGQLKRMLTDSRESQLALPAPREFTRPPEMGPLWLSIEVINRIRESVFEEQMEALSDTWAKADSTFKRELVRHWAFHWSDHVVSLTGGVTY